MTTKELDEIEAQIDSTVPYYVPRLIATIRELQRETADRLASLSETPPPALTADDFDELLDCLDASPRLNTEQHHALHSKLVAFRRFYDSEWAAVEGPAPALEGYRCCNPDCDREFYVAKAEEAALCPICGCRTVSALVGPFGVQVGAVEGPPQPPPSRSDAFMNIGAFCRHREGCTQLEPELGVCNCGLLKAQNELLAALYQVDLSGGVPQPPPSGWQPISTAPDNIAVLVFVPNWDHYGPGIYRAIHVNFPERSDPRWHSSAWACGRDFDRHVQPTGWQPLPEEP